MDPLFIIVDLFCGFGGTTTGFEEAELPKDQRELALDALVNSSINEGSVVPHNEEWYKICKVIACVNHDPKAIKSHWLNYPDVKHFEEDIRTLDLTGLIKIVRKYRRLYPNAKLILWASLECTNFSKAKGGQPRDADSRTLAEHLYRYIHALKPDYIQIENVVEFMSWGPLDDNGKPISRKNGQDFMRWCNEICSFGYRVEWRELNSADFGAYTSRNRLFGCFAKEGLPIVWPQPTHSKKASDGMFGDLKKWMPVKDVLDFTDEGQSIFNRKKPLSDKTLERIYAGLIKYVAKGDTAFISKYFSGRPKGKVNSVESPAPTVTTFGGNSLIQTKNFSDLSIDSPAGALTTIDHHALVNASFITQRNSGDPESKIVDVEGPARTITATGGNQDLVQAQFLLQTYAANSQGHNTFSIDGPARTVTTRDATALVQPEFLMNYYSNGGELSSIDNPAPVIPTKDRTALVQPVCLLKYDSTDKTGKHYPPSLDNPSPVLITQARLGLIQAQYAQIQSIDQPAGAVMPNDKHSIVEAVPFVMPTAYDNGPKSVEEPAPTLTASRRHHYIVNPSHGGHTTSTEAPCPVIIARQDKAPLYLVQVENGQVAIAVFDCDSEVMVRIKQFMAAYGLIDIKMRMLRVKELLKIQGFPDQYQMIGNQTDQKKFIGNSVHPKVPKAWAEAMALKLLEVENKQRA